MNHIHNKAIINYSFDKYVFCSEFYEGTYKLHIYDTVHTYIYWMCAELFPFLCTFYVIIC